MRKHKTETFENTNICSACKTESSFRMIAACTLTQTTVQKPRAELQRQELQHHISLHYLCLLKNSLQKLYYHFSGEKKKKIVLLNLEDRKSYRRTVICFNHLFFHPRAESMDTIIHKNQNQFQLLLNQISNCSKAQTKSAWAKCLTSCTPLGYSKSQPKLPCRN